MLSFLDTLEDFLRASIAVTSTRLLLFSVSLHVSGPYNKLQNCKRPKFHTVKYAHTKLYVETSIDKP
jgi:hypothetical protein